jgi:hypothetical protein
MSDLNCGSYGEPIVGEPSSGDPDLRKPCPRCGSLARAFNLHATASIRLTGTAQLSVISYPEALLSTANDLFKQSQFGIAVVVAHMACEVAAERALSASFIKRGVQYLEEPVLGFLNGYNLAAERNRKLTWPSRMTRSTSDRSGRRSRSQRHVATASFIRVGSSEGPRPRRRWPRRRHLLVTSPRPAAGDA